MRMRLYAAEFVRPDTTAKGHIVAPTSEMATQFAKEYHDEIGVKVTRISVSRIDDQLPPEHRQGLDDMLESAPIGFASQCEPLGWFVHSVMPPRLALYRIESEDGGVVQVVAPNPDVASVIWLSTLDLGDDGTHPLWSISNGPTTLMIGSVRRCKTPRVRACRRNRMGRRARLVTDLNLKRVTLPRISIQVQGKISQRWFVR